MTTSFWLGLFLFFVAESAQAQTVPQDGPKEAFAAWADWLQADAIRKKA